MKNIKKLFFTLLILCVGMVTVKAEINPEAQEFNMKKWESFVKVYDSAADFTTGCNVFEGAQYTSSFKHKETKTCVMTAIQEAAGSNGNKAFNFVFQSSLAESGGESISEMYFGDISASSNNLKDTNILLSEIVELIYRSDSKTTNKLKALANQQTDWKAGGVDYVLRAGSSSDALYVFGCYVDSEGKCIASTEGSIKLDYNASTKKFTFEMAPTASNVPDFRLAQLFTLYLVDYLMETTPNYDEAMSIISDKDKKEKIENEFKNTYGSVSYPDNNGDGNADSIKVDLIAKGDINSQIVTLYNNAGTGGNAGGNTGGTTGGTTGGNTGENTGDATTEDDDVPNTGAFVNIFAIVALLSVGTVLVLGNKRKLFKI